VRQSIGDARVICSSIYLTIYPSNYLSIYLSIHLSIYPSIYLSIYLSIPRGRWQLKHLVPLLQPHAHHQLPQDRRDDQAHECADEASSTLAATADLCCGYVAVMSGG
jgi:hypothetical protein